MSTKRQRSYAFSRVRSDQHLANVIREVLGLGPLFDRKRTRARQRAEAFFPRPAEPIPAVSKICPRYG